MTDEDFLYRFQLERSGVRGAIARLDHAWRRIRDNGDYDEATARLLGRTLAANALFTSGLKFEGRLSIHLRDSGALRLLFADCTHDGRLRGIARVDASAASQPTAMLVPGARLAITIENAATESRYQGLVPVEDGDLVHALEGYFRRSEQLPTKLALAAGAQRCGGLMLQQVAIAGGAPLGDADGWNRAEHLLATLTDAELLELPPEQVLLRLFHEEGVRLQPPQALAFGCTCSRERVGEVLRSLGREENESVLAEQGSIQITCEFCNRRYVFDEDDVAALFAADSPAEPPPTRH